jgi:hypothetical protein
VLPIHARTSSAVHHNSVDSSRVFPPAGLPVSSGDLSLGPFVLRQPLLLALAPVILLAGPALRAQVPSARSMRAPRPPVIDGRLDEEVWQLAVPIGPLLQVEPIEGARPSERTEVRILHDDEYLYFGVRCFDSYPAGIIGTQPQRDANLDPDDRVEIVLDTFNDQRNAYFFQMNPVGSRGDALITDNGRVFNKPWDGIWRGQSSIDALGWTMELALPFKTLAFDPDAEVWRLNVQRFIRRHNEVVRWTGASQDYGVFVMSQAGELTGLEGMTQGVGLDVTPYAKADWRKNRTATGEGQASTLHVGVDAFYRVTPNLSAALTAFTDFAETEVDERRINLSRFPLFFPERRDFFLQDSGQFEFADNGRSLIPFFSRRIGLVAGEVIPIDIGAKLTGRAGDWNIGALDVRTGDRTALGSENLFVARLSRNVGEESTVGGIVTDGDPSGAGSNSVVGVDANFRGSSIFGDGRLNASAWALHSTTSGISSNAESAYGVSVSSPNQLWTWGASAKEIGDDFNAALGFVPRTGIRSYRVDLGFRPRPELDGVRRIEFGLEGRLITDVRDETESSEIEIQPFGILFESGDTIEIEIESSREVLIAPFDIIDTVTIPVGDYRFTRAKIEFGTSSHRPLSFFTRYEVGEFYDGDSRDLRIGFGWRPSAGFTGSFSWIESQVSLPGGRFTSQVAQLRGDIYFGPDVSWSNFAQWDSDSRSPSLNSRVRWIIEPGNEIFFVVDQSWQRLADDSTVPLDSKVTVKGIYTVRF